MAVKMRLMRIGKTKQPSYRVVVMDGRKPRDGRYIEQIGRYDPRHDPSLIEIDTERAVDWLAKGAQPTETVRKLLEISGAFGRHAVASGMVHTVGAPSEDTTAEAAESAPSEDTTTEVEDTTTEVTDAETGEEE